MPRQKLLILIAVIVIVIGGIIYVTNQPNQSTPETPPTEQIRNQIIDNIKTNHPETAPTMSNLNWAGGRQDTGLVGAETYVYNSTNGWTVTIQYPVVPNPIYTITATYASGNMAVDWQGTIESNGIITETTYTYTPETVFTR